MSSNLTPTALNEIKNALMQRFYKGKPILVIAGVGDLKKYPLSSPYYRRSYKDFGMLASKTFSIFFVRAQGGYLGNGTFLNGLYFKNKKFIPYRGLVRASVVYDKGNFHLQGSRDWAVVNKAKFNDIVKYKYRTYQALKKFYKPTYCFYNQAQLKRVLGKIRTKLAVYKPNRGYEGRGVVIVKKEKIFKLLRTIHSGILQEFIDTSAGVPGIYKGTHDLRITIMSGKIVQCYIRIPKKGSLLANVAQGGRVMEVPIKKIPPAALKIARFIDKKFKKFGPRGYAIDFGFEKGRPYLMEINNSPGLPYKKWPLHYKRWHKGLYRTLRLALKSIH